ncbi:S-adenosylmethionine-dependent nucleotide dehydratase RSAD2-like [Rhopilema esculentum]|uniref:S-adenosylmethionine-dependent nucleotide dehydratase RSAD2-like n=1 Tax=Rhopilema esculentum TaxID=499914 RepID=UPI0031D5A1E9
MCDRATTAKVPESVNYHFTRQCNYKCGFCFHTAKTSFVQPLDEAKRGLKLLRDAGMQKINFSGGEPFLHKRGKFLGEMVKYCKEEIEVPSVSIISNGSLITEKWMQEYGEFVDILGISCDSFDESVNEKIGRHTRGKNHLETMHRVHDWCKKHHVLFKINSVINSYNVDEDMGKYITELEPVRWKIFQCLPIDGENFGEGALRQVEQFLITDEQFKGFIERHSHVPQLVPESNDLMKQSYFIVDEYFRFIDNGTGRTSKSILAVGVEAAIKESGFIEKKYLDRRGRYNWSKNPTCESKNLSW